MPGRQAGIITSGMSVAGGTMRGVDDMTRSSGSVITDFATWEPLLRLIRAANTETLAYPGSHLQGMIAVRSHSVPTGYHPRSPEEHRRVELVVGPLRVMLRSAGVESVSFKAQFAPDGHVILTLMIPPQDDDRENHEGAVTRVAGSLPEPYRRLPSPSPGAVRHPSADPSALQRLVRETYPGLTPATEEEIAAAEDRIGMPLPPELKALYRMTCGPGYKDPAATMPGTPAAGILWEIPIPIGEVRLADPWLRYPSWYLGARDVALTPPGAAVQQLAASPGWIVFGDDHGAYYYAIDLTPAEGGHVGQVIGLPIDESIGATLMAPSLTAFLQLEVGKEANDVSSHAAEELAAVTIFGGQAVLDAAAQPALEVLILGDVQGKERVSVAALASLPRLRTLIAHPGRLADPPEVAALVNLEYMELGMADWRILLDARAFPPNLQAASIITPKGNLIPRPQPDNIPYVNLANELAARWGRPQTTLTVIEGDLT